VSKKKLYPLICIGGTCDDSNSKCTCQPDNCKELSAIKHDPKADCEEKFGNYKEASARTFDQNAIDKDLKDISEGKVPGSTGSGSHLEFWPLNFHQSRHIGLVILTALVFLVSTGARFVRFQ